MRLIPCLFIAAMHLTGHAVSAQTPWSLALYGGYATGVDNSDYGSGSLAVIGDVYRRIGRTTALGVEVGYQEYESESSAGHMAGVLRIRSPTGRWRPYAVTGLGIYAFRQVGDDFLAPGLSAGGGLEFHPNSGLLGIGLGARFDLAGRIDEDGLLGAGVLTLMLGLIYR